MKTPTPLVLTITAGHGYLKCCSGWEAQVNALPDSWKKMPDQQQGSLIMLHADGPNKNVWILVTAICGCLFTCPKQVGVISTANDSRKINYCGHTAQKKKIKGTCFLRIQRVVYRTILVFDAKECQSYRPWTAALACPTGPKPDQSWNHWVRRVHAMHGPTYTHKSLMECACVLKGRQVRFSCTIFMRNSHRRGTEGLSDVFQLLVKLLTLPSTANWWW